MNSRRIKTLLTVLSVLALLMQGCSDTDSTKTQAIQQNDPRLIGTWRQTSIGKEKVSGIVVKLIFAEDTMTMDAPGCLIIGDYRAADGMLTYTITTMRGERCAKTQKPGKSDRVRYYVTHSQLRLIPLSAGEESRTTYERMEKDSSP